jgi:hypothetical protein
MKTQVPGQQDACPVSQAKKGFALVVTLSLMILMTVVAVGLLTLSSISLRAAGQGDAMATAQANARLALMLAIGDLQKFAGSDQRVTARADVLGESIANPRLTGVWKSWEIKASAPPSESEYEKPARDGKFVGWLASSLDGKEAARLDFARTLFDPKTSASLWGKGSLGPTAAAADLVVATKVPTTRSRGAFAWAVMDEGVKVRINTPHVDGAATTGLKTAQLGSGQRPNTSSIGGLDRLDRKFFQQGSVEFSNIQKGISRSNLGFAVDRLAAGTGRSLESLTHEVSFASAGLFTNTASGGLKEDLSLLTNTATLPAAYRGKGVYQSRLGISGVSDPRWESLQQFARLYRDSSRLVSSGGVPVIKAQGPANWRAATGSDPSSGTPGIIQLAPPPGVVLMPTIAKVQVVFSLLTRDIYRYPKVTDTTPKIPGTEAQEREAQLHNPWGNNFAGSSYDYLLHLLYTPVVTLHNPYNVAIEFSDLRLLFGNVPFALQVFRNNVAQTTAPAPLDQMYYQDAERGLINKRFGMTLRNQTTTGTVGTSLIRLLPGEVMLFSPYIAPTRTWADEYSGRTFSDWDNGDRTLNILAIPGWRGDGIGFDLDWFCPASLRVSSTEVENGRSMNRAGCIGARAQDEFHVQFAPLSVPGLSRNKFTVEMFARSPSNNNAVVSSGVLEFDYESPKGLQDTLLGKDGTIRFPRTGTINTMAMHSHSTTQIKDIATVRPFAMVSAHAKTTLGGLNPDGEDGKLATKPWSFSHASVGASTQKVVSSHPAQHSHEIDLQRLNNGTLQLLQFDPKTGRGNAITGQTGNTGLKFGVMYDVPLAPLQSLNQLNGANPGGSSGYLPRFAQPIGNSWAHPLLSSSEFKRSQVGGDLLDHSYLLNLALYDHFYFSGLADDTGSFGTARNSAKQIEGFAAGQPLVDPRLSFYRPDGNSAATFAAEMSTALSHTKVAAWQMMNGAFNINSTSVNAWKAMLGSVHDAQAVFNQINKAAKTSAVTALPNTADGKVRISRFRLPASESEADGATPQDGYWLGPREYSDADLQILAEKIVEQVRLRGPFLSLSEFVNRQLGNGENAQRGALQQAIDNARLNDKISTDAGAGHIIPEAKVAPYKYANTKAGAGPSNQGAPGYLSQADLLGVLGNAATPRSDTFTVRAHGEARDSANKVTASAVCEAIIQRVPDYIDPADAADVLPAALTSVVNQNFGRRFQVVSFRWLGPSEI